VIVREGLPEPVRASMPLWTGCVAGALEEREFLSLLVEVGFENASIEATRVYTRDDAAALLEGTGLEPTLADDVEGRIISGFVRATKPGGPRPTGAKPARRLEALSRTANGPRACGCDDECCT
jgi:arsenite methyltransferase